MTGEQNKKKLSPKEELRKKALLSVREWLEHGDQKAVSEEWLKKNSGKLNMKEKAKKDYAYQRVCGVLRGRIHDMWILDRLRKKAEENKKFLEETAMLRRTKDDN